MFKKNKYDFNISKNNLKQVYFNILKKFMYLLFVIKFKAIFY